MPQTKEVHREYMRKYRQGSQGNEEGSHYPAILYALTDPKRRRKLEKIYHSLKDFKVADRVYYGCSKDSVPFDVVGDLLEATG